MKVDQRLIAKVAVLLSISTLTACEITKPVAVISDRGDIMRGTTTASMTGAGSYTVSDGTISCTGNYNSLDTSTTIPLSILCNNGLTGIGSATRTLDGMSGSGTFTTTDGRNWRFVFGENVAALL